MARNSGAPQRRSPLQKRSRQRVERILEAARVLLRDGGVHAVTTTSIAGKAGVPVGSIYQYFPNKTAILTALLSEYLEGIQQVLHDWERDGPYAAGWRPFFEQLHRRLKRVEANGRFDLDWVMATHTHPELAALDRQHAEVIAAATARMLRRFGSRWPDAKLRRLSLFLYRMNLAAMMHPQETQPRPAEGVEWGTIALMALLESSLPKT